MRRLRRSTARNESGDEQDNSTAPSHHPSRQLSPAHAPAMADSAATGSAALPSSVAETAGNMEILLSTTLVQLDVALLGKVTGMIITHSTEDEQRSMLQSTDTLFAWVMEALAVL